MTREIATTKPQSIRREQEAGSRPVHGARVLRLREWDEGQRFELAMARREDRGRFSAFVLGVL
jgi:hypothetical protein